MYAAVFAAILTVAFIHIQMKIQGVENVKNSTYFKPAFLIAILVYGIVHFGQLE
jgi:hypothetical protein